MKKPIKTYLYKNRQFIGEYQSIADACQAASENTTSARDIIAGKRKITRKGYVFTTHPLTQEEIQKLPIKEETRFNEECKVQMDNQIEYEVDCQTHKVFHLGRSKNERLMMLKKFIYNQMEYKWGTQPKQITALQKRFLQEIFDSLMF